MIKKLTITELQRLCIVIMKNDFEATWSDIATVTNLNETEAKELYLQLIRSLENSELSERTSYVTPTS